MVIGSSVGWFIGQNILNVYYHKVIKLNIIRFYKETFSKTFVTFIVIVLVGYFIAKIPGTGWFNFIAKSTLYTIIYSFSMYKFGTLQFERELIIKPINPIINRFKSIFNL